MTNAGQEALLEQAVVTLMAASANWWSNRRRGISNALAIACPIIVEPRTYPSAMSEMDAVHHLESVVVCESTLASGFDERFIEEDGVTAWFQPISAQLAMLVLSSRYALLEGAPEAVPDWIHRLASR